MKRTRQTAAPAAAVGMICVAVCLGAAVDVSASPALRLGQQTANLSAVERQALASILACISGTARQLGDEHQPAHAHLLSQSGFTAALDAPAQPSAASACCNAHNPLGPGVLARSHLLNLPPPAGF